MAGRIRSTIRSFLDNESSGGLLLIAAAAFALLVANSPMAESYFHALHAYVGPLSLQHWVNDALMAVFFLMVGLEIKREMIDGHLSSWSRRILPGAAAIAGMAVPAAVFLLFNAGSGAARGWAIPSATDIAFALAVITLLGPRVPTSLKVFLAALAIIDDLGAVVVIGLFYTTGLSMPDLGAAAAVFAVLVAINLAGVRRLTPYVILGLALWVFVYRSGVHATIAGVLLALTIPLNRLPGHAREASPLHRLEHLLLMPVSFIVVPVFGFANAGVSFAGLSPAAMLEPVTLGVAAGLVLGKLIGVFCAVWVLVRAGLADLPLGANWTQVFGTALLCGIGFTMSLFISLLAFDDVSAQDQAKIGILLGSLLSGLSGYWILRTARGGRSQEAEGAR